MQVYYRNFIAVAALGEGSNIYVSIGLNRAGFLPEDEAAIKRTLNKIDHAYLGVDVELGFKPEASALPKWIFNDLLTEGLEAVASVETERGDGLKVRYGQPG